MRPSKLSITAVWMMIAGVFLFAPAVRFAGKWVVACKIVGAILAMIGLALIGAESRLKSPSDVTDKKH